MYEICLCVIVNREEIWYNSSMKELIYKSAERFRLNISDDQAEKLEKYAEILLDWNQKMNLTAVTEPENIVLKHFIDSILGAKHLLQGASLCDVGTGAGFPGLPLKIFRSDLRLTLMDSLNKRVRFLEEVVRGLSIDGVEAIHIRAEDAGKSPIYREKFDVVTARAVAKLNTLCEYALPLVRVGGFFLAYKGSCAEEIALSERAIRVLGGKIAEIEEFNLSDEADKRTLVKIEKISPTPKQYPRGKNKERLDPIV